MTRLVMEGGDESLARGSLSAVLWDMDGTLIDSQPIWIQAQTDLVREFGGQWTRAQGLTLVGVSMQEVALALQTAGVTLPEAEIIGRIIRVVASSLRSAVPWLPGARELVTGLSAAGVPQAIVTSAPVVVAAVVAEALPPGAIQAIVADDHVSNSKPHPEPYVTAALALGVPPTECVAIEDSHAGLLSAMAAGCTAVGIPRDVVLKVDGDWVRRDSLVGVGVADLADFANHRRS